MPSLVAPGHLRRPVSPTLSYFYGVCERSQPLSPLSVIPTQAPFYPIEATAKGATASEYGLVTASLSYHQDQRNTNAIIHKDHQAGRPFLDPFLIFLFCSFSGRNILI